MKKFSAFDFAGSTDEFKQKMMKILYIILHLIFPIILSTSTYANTIHEAVKNNDIKLVKKAITNGVNINSQNSEGFTPLYICAFKGHYKIAKILVNNGANINAKNGKSQLSSLAQAVSWNRYRIVKLLIKNGANVNIQCGYNSTPLHFVTSLKVAELLVKNGANVNAINKLGELPIHSAAKKGKYKIIHLLIKHGSKINVQPELSLSPLGFAIYCGSYQSVKVLIDNKAKIQKTGYTSLHIAARYNRIEIAKLLLSKGAPLNIKDNRGQTPLAVAIKRGHKHMIQFLKKHGAK